MKKLLATALIGVTINVQAFVMDPPVEFVMQPYALENNLNILNQFEIPDSYLSDIKLQMKIKEFFNFKKQTFVNMLTSGQNYIPTIKKELERNNIPSAFLFLSMGESGLRTEAVSTSNAKGLWQFLEATAKDYDLRINNQIDERMDYRKSTIAATKHLKRMNKMFKKWYLTVLAYNAGEGRILEGLTRATIDMYCDNVGLYNCKRDGRIDKWRRTLDLYRNRTVSFKEVLKIYEAVKQWNITPGIKELLSDKTHLKEPYIPEKSKNYIRKIIALGMMSNHPYIKSNHAHLLNGSNKTDLVAINVNNGVYIEDLSKIIGLSTEEFKKYNRHFQTKRVPINNGIYTAYIPKNKLFAYERNKSKLQTQKFNTYIVKKGDNLIQIGKKFKINYEKIRKVNKLKSYSIRINQVLKIPEG